MSARPDDPTGPARRDRAVRLTVAASVGAKTLSVICTLVQVPLALRCLGPEAFGVWVALAAGTVAVNFVDLGLGVGMQRAMADALGRNDPDRMRRAFCTGALALGGLALPLLVLGLPVAFFFNWADALKIHGAGLRADVGLAVAVTLVAAALALPLNAAPRLAAAAQCGWLQAIWIAAGSVVTLAATAWAAHAQWGLVAFVAATALVPTLQGLGATVHLWCRLGWAGHSADLLPRGARRILFNESFLFAAPQFGFAVVQAVPPLALAAAAGPGAAGAFNLLQRLFSPVTQGQIFWLTPVSAAWTEATARGDGVWVRRAWMRAWLVTASCGGALALLAFFSRELLGVWVGRDAADTAAALAWPAGAWAGLLAIWQLFVYFLTGIGRLRELAAWGTIATAIAVAAMFAAGRFGWGATGVLAAGGAALALGGLPSLTTAATRALRDGRGDAR